MTEPCLKLDELAGIADLPGDDPRRLHLEGCPRCTSLVAAYRDFMAATTTPAGADPRDAEARLAERLAREWGASAGDGNAGASAHEALPGDRGGGLRRRLEAWWSLPALRPALAVAVIAIVAGGVFLVPALRSRLVETPVLRGGRPDSLEAAVGFEVDPPRPGPAGTELSWGATAGAQRYQVILYSTDLVELSRLEPVAGTRLLLRRADLPAHVAPGTSLLWRVTALRGNEEVGLSSVGTVTAP